MQTYIRSITRLLLVLTFGCGLVEAQNAANPNNPNNWRAKYVVQAINNQYAGTTLVAAHRGGHSLYGGGPHQGIAENSLESILAAAQDGAELIEVDIRQTSDGVPIVSHDSKWGRETNVGCAQNSEYDPNTNTGSNPAVNSVTANVVRTTPTSGNCGFNGYIVKDSITGQISPAIETPATLQQVIDYVKQHNIGAALALDIKDQNAFNASAQIILSNKDNDGYNFVDDVLFKVPSTGVKPDSIASTFSGHTISILFPDWQYFHVMPVYQTSAIAPFAYGTEMAAQASDPEHWVLDNLSRWWGSYSQMFSAAELDLKQTGGILSTALKYLNDGYGWGIGSHRSSNFQPVPETSTGYYQDGSCAPCAQLSNFFFNGVPYGLPSDTDDQRADTGFQLTSTFNNVITTDNYLPMIQALQDNNKRQNIACLMYNHSIDRCESFTRACNASPSDNELPCGGNTYQCLQGINCTLPIQNYTPPVRVDISAEMNNGQVQAPAQRVAYFDSWSVYQNNFYLKNLDTQGIASRLTTIIYSFENIDPVNLTCFAANQSEGTDPNNPTNYDGASDAYADYQMGFTSANSVDGSTDQWGQALEGNFNQLRELKKKYPNLKILISIGGWTYSKFFSDAAATDASRKKFVSSCINLYINGNLPVLTTSPAGGQGAAAGIFDGFDIDWEYPASANGNLGNHYGPQDTANYTALLAEFRTELNALGGEHYMLTAAVPAGPSDIAKVQVGSISQYLDFADLMSYDYHGAFETNGPTNFQAPLFDSPSSPAFGTQFDIDDSVNNWINNGFPASKLNLGIAFYGRGWTGVPDGGTNGLYQSVTGATAPFTYSQEAGVADWKELQSAGVLASSQYFDPNSASSWVYDGTNFWGIETPYSLMYKVAYIQQKGLGGVMMYSLEDDDVYSTLMNAATGNFTSPSGNVINASGGPNQ